MVIKNGDLRKSEGLYFLYESVKIKEKAAGEWNERADFNHRRRRKYRTRPST